MSNTTILILMRLCVALIFCNRCDARDVEVLWDKWGVPHVYGTTDNNAWYGAGWVQMKCHGDAILRLYGQARGRAAEYWGDEYTASDTLIHTLGIPARTARWARDKDGSEFGKLLQAYVDGMNDCARQTDSTIAADSRKVLPITTGDVLAHLQRLVYIKFLQIDSLAQQPATAAGSNAWAIGPARSLSGRAMILMNPHLSWTAPEMRLFEMQIVGPTKSIYGAAFIGLPTVAFGFNDRVAWTQTMNNTDAVDLYELSTVGDSYQWENGLVPFQRERVTLKIRQSDGTLTEKPIEIVRSNHGPVIRMAGGKAVAVRIAGMESDKVLEQYWAMGASQDRKEFEMALRMQQTPIFNFVFADSAGEILFIFNGQLPVRPSGDYNFWQKPVSGSSSKLLWERIHPYDSLPRLANPTTAWLQNTNDPPWYCTFPVVLKREDFPEYLNPRGLDMRSQGSVKMLRDATSLTLEDLQAARFSTKQEMAERLVDDLVAAAVQANTESSRHSAEILKHWDRKCDSGSRGAVLFYNWIAAMKGILFRDRWNENDPVATPKGLRDPVIAVSRLVTCAAELERTQGDAGVAWGDVFRVRVAGADVPASGAPTFMGNMHCLYYAPDKGGRTYSAISGDTFSAVVEFTTPVAARVLLVYGNATQQGSRHQSDQLALFTEKRMRPAWLRRSEVEANLESKELLERH